MPKKITTIDYLVYIIPILLVSMSVSLIYSLVFSNEDSTLAIKQMLFGIIGVVLMALFSIIDYRSYKGLWWILYTISILLLIYVDFFGKVVGGAMRWIDLGFFNLQPSEVAKMALIISLSIFFSMRYEKLVFKDYLLSLVLFVPPIFLILKEPDLGTAIVVFFIYIGILFAAKPTKKQKIVIISSLIIIVGIFIAASANIRPFSFLLKDYQRKRVITFINPDSDPLGQGYNVKQAQIAIGSGGLFGKGLGRGSQSQLEYLSMPHTDFIFAGAGEALGFLGTSVIIALLLLLVIRIYSIGQMSQDHFGTLLASGTAAMFMSQSVINIGMNLGLAPVTGIPLPFLSSGGTSLIICFSLLGIIQSIYIRHRKLSFY